ncbi:hypothetical protein, partial [Epibacterium ulvae]|uniref:hypothetical protein n=1 Tax=Epibacterium ulvae TaxID=1156985 RepID=UPI001B8BF2A8
VPSSPNPPTNKGIESAKGHSIKDEFFNKISPERSAVAWKKQQSDDTYQNNTTYKIKCLIRSVSDIKTQ